MRKSAVLDSLFPATRKGVLSAIFTRPDKWWYLSELAEFLETSPSSLQRDLASLAESGILEQRREGTRSYVRAQRLSPIFTELKNIFEKTTGMVPVLSAALTPFGRKIVLAFIYGSIARGQEHAASDVDLMVIGHIGLADLAPALRKVQRNLEREINATVFSVSELRDKAKKDHFLVSVLKRPKQFIKGSQRELDAIIGA
jgi:predicted nucleotidyltransferase